MLKKYAIAASAAGLLISLAGISVLAAGPGYNPPPAVSDVCNAGHGAFGAFSDPSLHGDPSSGQPPYFGDNVLGSARAGATGENNSSYSQSCRTQ